MELNVTIRAGRWEAVISPWFGANLTGLSFDGCPILRSPVDECELRQNPYLFGNPLLLPPNRTRDGLFCYEGSSYTLPVNEPENHNHIHGYMFDAPFTATKRLEDELCCSFQNGGDRYPFPFTFSFCYKIREDGLRIGIAVRNDGVTAMPLILGFHTTFVEPESFAVPIKEKWERDERFLPTGKLLPLNSDEEQIKRGCSLGNRALSGFYTSGGHKVRIGNFCMETSAEFSQWVLFNGGGGTGYLCVEPQTGPVDGLNIPDGMRTVGAGETAKYWICFGIY